MIEKRFENRLNKSNVKFNTLNPVWDNEKEDALNVFEMINELNYLNDCCNNLIDDNTEYVAEINQMHKENEQLKKDLNSISHNWALMYDEAKNKVEELSKENKKLKARLGINDDERVVGSIVLGYRKEGDNIPSKPRKEDFIRILK